MATSIIRPMAAADLPAVLALARSIPEAPAWSGAEYRRFIQPHVLTRRPESSPEAPGARERAAWVAASDREGLLGFAAAGFLVAGGGVECDLEFIAVAGNARRCGIGRLLLAAVIGWARQRGAEAVRLEVRASNLPALGLYEDAGFRTTGRRRGYYRDPEEDAVLLQLDLPRS